MEAPVTTLVLIVGIAYLALSAAIGYSSVVLAARKDREARTAFATTEPSAAPPDDPPPSPPADAVATEWPHRPVRYFDLPTDDRHTHLPQTYAFRWGRTTHDPPLLWMHAHTDTLDAIERNLRLNRRRPKTGLRDPWE